MALSSNFLHWFCWFNTFSICFSCASAREILYSWYMRSWLTFTREMQVIYDEGWHRRKTYNRDNKDIIPDSSRRPEHEHWCPGLCLVVNLPAPWLCTHQRATALSSRCPVSQRGQRSMPGRWQEIGWTHLTRADHRKRVSRLWPRRSHTTWSGTLGSCTGVYHRTETWVWLQWKMEKSLVINRDLAVLNQLSVKDTDTEVQKIMGCDVDLALSRSLILMEIYENKANTKELWV